MAIERGLQILRHANEAPQGGRESPARTRLRTLALALARDEALIDAAYSYEIVPLESPAAPLLRAGGESLEAPWLLPAAGELTALACGVCTLGPALERRIGELFKEHRASLAVALHELANELLFAVARRAQDRMQAEVGRQGLTMSGELRAGDPGLALEAQEPVLRLAKADRIGVRLNQGLLMHPLKSTSMVLGVGVQLPASAWTRCDHCNFRDKCGARQRALAAQASA